MTIVSCCVWLWCGGSRGDKVKGVTNLSAREVRFRSGDPLFFGGKWVVQGDEMKVLW